MSFCANNILFADIFTDGRWGRGGPLSTADPCKMRAYATLVGLRYPPFFTPRELFLYVLPAFVSFFSPAFCLFFHLHSELVARRGGHWSISFLFLFSHLSSTKCDVYESRDLTLSGELRRTLWWIITSGYPTISPLIWAPKHIYIVFIQNWKFGIRPLTAL